MAIPDLMPPSLRLARRRGFTLVELMVVVMIVGILAVTGIALLREFVFSSKATEATAMVQSIRAAQERWRAESQGYLDVSSTTDSWYPNAKPDKRKFAWEQKTGNDYAKWRLLNPTVTGPVQFGYTVKAGLAGQPMPAALTSEKASWPTPTDPWYVIHAAADQDEDGTMAIFVATSLNGEIYSENEGE